MIVTVTVIVIVMNDMCGGTGMTVTQIFESFRLTHPTVVLLPKVGL